MSGPRRGPSVFISYRRGGGAEVARVVESYLDANGLDVFLDVDSLGGGHFDEQILRQIEARDVFILICSPGCFERCADPGDWVRRELEHALILGKRIVPVTLWGFEWPDPHRLLESIRDVTRHNAFEYSHNHWKQTRGKLLELTHVGTSTQSSDREHDRSSAPPTRDPNASTKIRVERSAAAPTDAARTEGKAASPSRRRSEPTVSEQVIGCTVLAVGALVVLWILSMAWRLLVWIVS